MAFTIKLRGASSGTIQHEYLCPVHGRFTADVPRADVPDEVFCPARYTDGKSWGPAQKVNTCGLTSPWSPSSIATKISTIGFSRGKAEEAPTKHALTTRDLADGMPMNEWRAKRAKLREERRRKRVREMRG
jgi:hypothetical protein